MAGRLPVPKTPEEELTYYKGIVMIQRLIAERAEYMGILDGIDQQIRAHALNVRAHMGWREMGKLLGLSETQAKTYLGGNDDDED